MVETQYTQEVNRSAGPLRLEVPVERRRSVHHMFRSPLRFSFIAVAVSII